MPPSTTSQASTIASALEDASFPSDSFARAVAALSVANAQMIVSGTGTPDIGKLSTARCVEAP